MSKTKIHFIVALISSILICTGAFLIPNPETEPKERQCTIINKYITAAGYKIEARHLLIAETEGKRIVIYTEPSTYSKAEIGKVLYFDLSDMYLKKGRDTGNEITAVCGLLCVISIGWAIMAGIAFMDDF